MQNTHNRTCAGHHKAFCLRVYSDAQNMNCAHGQLVQFTVRSIHVCHDLQKAAKIWVILHDRECELHTDGTFSSELFYSKEKLNAAFKTTVYEIEDKRNNSACVESYRR